MYLISMNTFTVDSLIDDSLYVAVHLVDGIVFISPGDKTNQNQEQEVINYFFYNSPHLLFKYSVPPRSFQTLFAWWRRNVCNRSLGCFKYITKVCPGYSLKFDEKCKQIDGKNNQPIFPSTVVSFIL